MPHPQHPEIRCGTCIFFAPGEELGECKKNAPRPSSRRDDYIAWWPETHDTEDWCGEHHAMAAILRLLEAEEAPTEDTTGATKTAEPFAWLREEIEEDTP